MLSGYGLPGCEAGWEKLGGSEREKEEAIGREG